LIDDNEIIDAKPSSRWRWGLCWLMFASTVLSYMDRQSVSLVAPYIKSEFRINNEGFGWVMAAFSLSYALFQVPAGYLADRCDVRLVYAWAVVWWSLSAAAMAFSPTLGMLMIFRALLGVGESFNWPCALRATSAILPPSDRSLGNGIFNSGAAIGAVLTPLVVPKLTLWYGWRPTFVIVASLGFAWVAAWLLTTRGPNRRRLAGRGIPLTSHSSEVETGSGRPTSRLKWSLVALLVFSTSVGGSAYRFGEKSIWWAIASLMIGLLLTCRVLPERALKGLDWAEALGVVVRLRRFWVLVVVSISVNVCWHFLINWLPTYLSDDRGMSYLAGGLWSTLPFLAADFGNLGGGAFSRFLAARGLAPSVARVRVMAFCTLFIGSGAMVGWVGDNRLAIVLLVAMAFGTAGFMANYFAFCQEVSMKHTGLIVGALGGLGNLFVALFLPYAGYIKDTSGSFRSIFLVVGMLPLVGLVALRIGWGKDSSAKVDEFRSASDDGFR
jgi:MFS transporter, ACS family, hexuronate transporter